MNTAEKLNEKTLHPWHGLLSHFLGLPQWVCVLDITDALPHAKSASDGIYSGKVSFETADYLEKFCQGMQVIDASESFRNGIGSWSIESFTNKVIKALQSAPLQLVARFIQTLAHGLVGQSNTLVGSGDNPFCWAIEFSQFALVNERQLVLAFVKESGSERIQEEQFTRFKAITQKAGDLVIVMSLNGELEFMNFDGQTLLGMTAPDLGIHNIKSILSPSSFEAIMRACSDLQVANGTWTGEIEAIDIQSSHKYHMRCQLFPMRERYSAQPVAWCLLANKIEVIDALKHEIVLRDRMLADASRMMTLGKVASQVIHEINNPMTVICGKAEKIVYLADQNSTELTKYRDCAQKILQMTERTDKIIRSVKSLAYRDTDEERVVISVKSLVDEVKDLLEVVSRKSGVELRMPEIDAGIEVRGTRLKLSQVLVNLLGNSVDAVSHLSQRWVEISAEAVGPWAMIRVKDSGGGIPHDVARRMFEGFFTTKGPGKGTGIGLNMSKQIVQDNGGDLYYDLEGTNTTFVVKLPLRNAANNGDKAVDWEEI